jgi:nucleoside-diphosphate-sugar epimerase
MQIAIFGANGLTGRWLTRLVLDPGHSAVAVTRRPDDFPIAHPRLMIAGADVRRDRLAGIIDGADAVLSALGVSFTRQPVDTYSLGARNIIDAMRERSVSRLVVVSSTGAFPAKGRRETPLTLRLFAPIITRTIGKTVYDDIRRMEASVRGSGLDWTIVRPSGLFDLTEATNYVAGEIDPIGAFTARIDLADYLVKLAEDTTASQNTVVVSTTEHTPTLWETIRREAFKSQAQPTKTAGVRTIS